MTAMGHRSNAGARPGAEVTYCTQWRRCRPGYLAIPARSKSRAVAGRSKLSGSSVSPGPGGILRYRITALSFLRLTISAIKPFGVATRSPRFQGVEMRPLVSPIRSEFHKRSSLCVAADIRTCEQMEQFVNDGLNLIERFWDDDSPESA